MEIILAIAIGVLGGSGVWLLLRPRTFQVIMGLSLISYAVNLFIFSMGRLKVDSAPVLLPDVAPSLDNYADPMPQSLVLTAIVIGFAMTAMYLVVMLATLPVARLMRRHGRKRIFLAATLPLALAGITGYLAVQDRSFGLLIVSHALLGLYIAVANFSRFAATDGLSTSLKPRAMSLVIAGGVVAAFTGPSLVNSLREWAGIQDFALCYAAFAGLAVLHALTILPIRTRDDDTRQPVPSGAQPHAAVPHPVAANAWQLVLHDRPLVAAMLSAAVGYGLMNLLMIQSSMNMTQLCMAFSDVNRAIQWHVLAMFLPSFVTGSIIQRVGTHAVIVAGFILIGISAAFNMGNDGYALLSTSLILLGLGWNFTYIGSSAMLNERLDQLRAQPTSNCCSMLALPLRRMSSATLS